MQTWGLSSSRCFSGIATTLVIGLGGCGQSESVKTSNASDQAAMALPRVVATTSVLCDLTQQVAADTVALTCLLQPGQDPHTYQARPSDRQAIEDADLVLYGGYNFAPAVVGLIEASSNSSPKVAVLEAAVPDPLMGRGHDHGHDHGVEESSDHNTAASQSHDQDGEAEEESHDHGHGKAAALVPDPHVWHDAGNNAVIVNIIANHLADINPDQTNFYQNNAAQLSTQFSELDSWIQAQVDTIPSENRRLVTTHDAFRYFAAAYGFDVKGALSGLSTEAKPSASALTTLVDQVKEARVPAIFAETTTNPDLINMVAKDAGAKVSAQPLFVEGPGGLGTASETTQEMLVSNTCTIVNALGGMCDAENWPK